jgi:hypothetical protein
VPAAHPLATATPPSQHCPTLLLCHTSSLKHRRGLLGALLLYTVRTVGMSLMLSLKHRRGLLGALLLYTVHTVGMSLMLSLKHRHGVVRSFVIYYRAFVILSGHDTKDCLLARDNQIWLSGKADIHANLTDGQSNMLLFFLIFNTLDKKKSLSGNQF